MGTSTLLNTRFRELSIYLLTVVACHSSGVLRRLTKAGRQEAQTAPASWSKPHDYAPQWAVYHDCTYIMRNKFLGTGESGYHPIRKIRICFSGLGHAMRYDFSVAYKLVISLIVLSICIVFRQWLDFLLILAATGLVLTAELFNSAIEALCDFIETSENEKIRVVKDISAAAAGISILLWVIILAIEGSRLWIFFFYH